jgi:DNA-binding CsgD family transcriptional regulator
VPTGGHCRRGASGIDLRRGGSRLGAHRGWIRAQPRPASGRPLRVPRRVGEPAVWVREALANFEDLGLPNFAGQCRAASRSMGEAVPRRPRSEARRVTGLLAARGVTPREAEVLAQIAAGRSNRELAGALHLSVRTVEKHAERLLMKTSHSRSELTRSPKAPSLSPPSDAAAYWRGAAAGSASQPPPTGATSSTTSSPGKSDRPGAPSPRLASETRTWADRNSPCPASRRQGVQELAWPARRPCCVLGHGDSAFHDTDAGLVRGPSTDRSESSARGWGFLPWPER